MENIPTRKKIKEGPLVKKGHVRHNWKTRWFVLYEDGLCYYKSEKELIAKGEINLRGCSIISPCKEYTKKDCVFRLMEHGGREFLLQSNDIQSRDEWTASIAEVIRNLEVIIHKNKEQLNEKTNGNDDNAEGPSIFESKITYDELLNAMQVSDAGIPLRNYTMEQVVYKLCFTGKGIIDWLLDWAFVKTRSEGALACGELLETAHLHPVGPMSNSSFKRKNARRIFCDNEEALYRFSALKARDEIDVIFEEDSSDSEDDLGNTPLLDDDAGEIVKQGFLIKKGHVRHNWKPRKFVLKENPASLLYYKPTKLKIAQGRIQLEGSCVRTTPLESIERYSQCGQISCLKAASLKAYIHQFEIETKKGTVYRLKADSEGDKTNWIQTLGYIIKKESKFC